MTTDRWLVFAAEELNAQGIEFPQMEARAILQHATGITREELISSSREFDEHDANHLVSRRLLGEPLAYVLGYKEFYSRQFLVNSNVLIPRPETEVLTKHAIGHAFPGAVCADIGTGSGCIGITASLEAPNSIWVCTDSSRQAIEVAAINANTLSAKTQLIHGDLLGPFRTNSLDLIVSNPPYVSEGDLNLSEEVARWEPASALLAGNDGLAIIRRLVEGALNVLKPGGKLLLEIGGGQASEVVAILDRWGPIIERDLAGIERVVVATRPNGH